MSLLWPLRVSVAAALVLLAARGGSPAAFGRRCIPPGCVAPRSNTPGILTRRALPGGRIAALGATPDFHHGLLALDATGQEPQAPERGEQLLNGSCRTCHDLRPVDIKALDQDGWMQVVRSMIEEGAELKADEVPVLVDYLVKHHGPLPDGPGKDILLNTCTHCHDLQRIRRQGRSAEGWLEILEAMLNEGAALSEQDLPVLLRYLSRSFKPERQN